MAIYKRGGVYWYEFVFDGTRHRGSAQTSSQKVARQREASERLKLASGKAGIEDPADIPTLKNFSAEFMGQISVERAAKPRTITFYQEKIDRLLESSLAGLRLDQIDESKIDAYKRARISARSRHGKPMSPASVNRELATLRRLLRMAQEWKRIKAVPRIRLLEGETAREFVLSRDDEKRYLDALPAEMRRLCTLLIETGLRVGEALTLDWQQVNLKENPGFLSVRAVHAKSGKTRSIPLTPRARAVLEAGTAPRKGLVFRNAEGGRLYHTWLNQQHAAVRTALGFPAEFVLHSLRHTFGTRLGETGAESFTIMGLMGHSTVIVSQKYVHPTTQSMRAAMERMSAAGLPTNIPTASKGRQIKNSSK